MKRYLLLIIVALLPLCMSARTAAKAVRETRLVNLINQYSGNEGFEVVKVGSIATAAVKSMIRMSLREDNDPDAKEVAKLISGIKKIAIVDFDDCESSIRNEFKGKLQKALSESELLIEAKDGSDKMQIYGLLNGDGAVISDFVLYVPGDCSLICLFGSVSLDSLANLTVEK